MYVAFPRELLSFTLEDHSGRSNREVREAEPWLDYLRKSRRIALDSPAGLETHLFDSDPLYDNCKPNIAHRILAPRMVSKASAQHALQQGVPGHWQ